MTNTADMSRERLEAALRTTAADVDYPPTPQLAAAVRARIEKERPVRRPSWRWQPAAVTIAVLALVCAGALALSPGARDAVADFVGLDDVRIGFDDPAPSPSIAGRGPVLGRPVTLAEAEGAVDFEVKLPELLGLPAPEIYLTRPPTEGMVSLYYPDAYEGAEEPALLVTQFEASLDGAFFKKLGVQDQVEFLTVRDVPGYWIEGTHFFYYFDESGEMHEESIRLAGNVLLWEENGVVYRIEGGFGKQEALKVAVSLP